MGISREETIAGVHVFMVREGRVVNGNEFVLDRGRDAPDEDLLHTFLLRYYDATTSIPHEVIVERELKMRQQWKHGSRTSSTPPMAQRFVSRCPDAAKSETCSIWHARMLSNIPLMRYKVRTNYEDKRINDALLQLESALAMDVAPMRIECFDISTIHGSYTVASA